MRKTAYSLLLLLAPITGRSQQPPESPERKPAYEEILPFPETETSDDVFSGEGESVWFVPPVSGNRSYFPLGRLARQLFFAGYRPRGYDPEHTGYRINGAAVRSLTESYPEWDVLTGIRAIAYDDAETPGLLPGLSEPGLAGGNHDLRTAGLLRGTQNRLIYSLTDRSYTHRLRYSGHFESEKRQRNLSLGVDRRWGRDGFVDGLFTDLTTVSAAADKRFGKQTVSLFYTGTFGKRGLRSAATEETYELAGNPYYNPNWGYQNGKVRNAKVRGTDAHFAVLSHTVGLGSHTVLHTALSFRTGRNTYSQPVWYDAPTPYPDYYRYLPSFPGNPETAEAARQAWESGNTAVTQIDWNGLYEANRFHRTDDPEGNRSHYALRNRVTDRNEGAVSMRVEYRPGTHFGLTGGLDFQQAGTHDYARMKDLLGGDYWLDIDQYLLDDEYYGDKLLNDVRNPERRVREGDRFGYDYRLSAQSWKAWGTAACRSARWQGFASLLLGETAVRRTGNYEKEMYPGNLSHGKSERLRFREYTVKAGGAFSPTLRHRIGLNLMLARTAPPGRESFIAPDHRNAPVPGIRTIQLQGAELTWDYTSPRVRLNLAAYLTFSDRHAETRNYYDDLLAEYVNLVMTDIGKLYGGVEIGTEIGLTSRLTLTAALAFQKAEYRSDPAIALIRDSDGKMLLEGSRSYLSGCPLPGIPQRAGTLTLDYRFPKRWRIGAALNYADGNHVSPNPVRRMNRALDPAGSPELREVMHGQEKLPEAVTVSVTLGKDFRFRNGHGIGLWVLLDNLADNRSIRYAGYEQMRFSRSDSDAGGTLTPFPSKYYYAYGRNYYCSLSYTF